MKIRVNVDTKAAIIAGYAAVPSITLTLSDADVKALGDKERQVLAEGLGKDDTRAGDFYMFSSHNIPFRLKNPSIEGFKEELTRLARKVQDKEDKEAQEKEERQEEFNAVKEKILACENLGDAQRLRNIASYPVIRDLGNDSQVDRKIGDLRKKNEEDEFRKSFSQVNLSTSALSYLENNLERAEKLGIDTTPHREEIARRKQEEEIKKASREAGKLRLREIGKDIPHLSRAAKEGFHVEDQVFEHLFEENVIKRLQAENFEFIEEYSSCSDNIKDCCPVPSNETFDLRDKLVSLFEKNNGSVKVSKVQFIEFYRPATEEECSNKVVDADGDIEEYRFGFTVTFDFASYSSSVYVLSSQDISSD